MAKMEVFSVEKFKTGKYDSVLRNGNPCRVLCTDLDSEDNEIVIAHYKLTGKEILSFRRKDGRIDVDWTSELDLMLRKKRLQPEDGKSYYYIHNSSNLSFLSLDKLKVYFIVYKDNDFGCKELAREGVLFESEQEAMDFLNKLEEMCYGE